MNRALRKIPLILLIGGLLTLSLSQCARVVAPTGGPKDTIAPVVLKTIPAQLSKNVSATELELQFDEYVTLKDLQKSFFVSPPLEQLPEVRERGRKLEVVFDKPLQPNTTYSLNFGNSIVDNNEGNPIIDYAFTFSTGGTIDTLKFNGVVFDAKLMQPVADAFVFFYDNDSLEAPLKHNPAIVAKTDKEGIFVAKTLKDKEYKVIAIKDANRNYLYDAGVDEIAFEKRHFKPVTIPAKADTISDSLWRSQLVPAARFKLFAEPKTRQYITGKSRTEKFKFNLFFNAPKPDIKKIEFDGLTTNDFIVDQDAEGDTLTYWLKDATRKVADTLLANITYMKSDSTGKLVETLEKISWELPLSKIDRPSKKDKKADAVKTASKPQPLSIQFDLPDGTANEDGGMFLTLNLPSTRIDSSKFHLFRIDDNDRKVKVPFSIKSNPKSLLSYRIDAKWVDDSKYEILVDSNAVSNILNQVNDSTLYAFSSSNSSKFGTFTFNVKGLKHPLIVQVLDKKLKLVREKELRKDGALHFPFIKADTYIVRIIEDINSNGAWDTGCYLKQVAPERVAYLKKDKAQEFILRSGWENEVSVDVEETFSSY